MGCKIYEPFKRRTNQRHFLSISQFRYTERAIDIQPSEATQTIRVYEPCYEQS